MKVKELYEQMALLMAADLGEKEINVLTDPLPGSKQLVMLALKDEARNTNFCVMLDAYMAKRPDALTLKPTEPMKGPGG